MGSDCARIGFDPTRDYRSVVAQQGRVTLEADVNEQASIASEALRLETIDVIGPSGTPDQDGYEVSIDSSGNLQVEPGIMYVGGWRMTLDKTVPLANQPEWLDQPPLTETTQGNSVVALLVTEQNISATEDQALLEVALGGPDTAARTRLMQHFIQWSTDASLCDAAETGLRETLRAVGLNWNPDTLALDFEASLRVSFYPPKTTSDPCCPPAQGGYLGTDNQLVMVTVSSFTAPSGTLLWGWNNASFLYRVTVVSPQVLQLDQAPVDNAHTPQPGQVIEILQTTMVLGDPSDDNYVAAPQGLLVTLGTGTVYDCTTQQLTLPPLPPGTTLPTDPNTLFIRLWQAEVTFTSGQRKELDSVSGLAVTVRIDALPSAPLQARPFWHFAVRPNTPQQVYPQRYTESPQPPDGPRQWLCDLAIVGPGPNEGWALVADCRKHFLPLTEANDCICCNLVLDPSQEWLSQLNVALAGKSNALTICFQPGTFTVAKKITFTNKVVKIIGAGQGTLIRGPKLEAVLEFDNCPSVTLSDLSVEAGLAGYMSSNNTVGLQGAVTIHSCNQVDVERVTLSCADADLRSASCLAVYNAVPPATAVGPQYNVRVLNSQFKIGYCQVGILMVNADRAQIEGNLVYASKLPLNYNLADMTSHPLIASRLAKNLLHSMTITNTAPPTTKKAKARLLKKQRKAAGTTAAVNAAKTAPAQPASTPAPPEAAPAPADTTESAPAATGAAPATNTIAKTAAAAATLPHVNLGLIGLAHINATFGTFQIQFISSAKLTNAWTDAFRAAGLSATSTEGEIHSTVKKTALAVFKSPNTVSLAFRNYANAVLPQLYSTSSQGIVVAGNLANDIRILNNTIDGAAQGIHVGLSDMKTSPPSTDLAVQQVQICGNTVNVLLTPEVSGDRHGIYLGCATSALISDNQIELTRGPNAGQDIYAIRVAGVFGPRILIERNCMLQFTYGIFAQPGNSPSATANLWKAADNASTSANWTASFRTTDNIP